MHALNNGKIWYVHVHYFLYLFYRSWLKSFGSWLLDLFSDEPGYSGRASPSHQQSSPHKLVDLLEKTEEFLAKIFKVHVFYPHSLAS